MPGITHWQSPALLRVLRDERLRAGDPRRAARGRTEPGRVPLAHLARVDGARAAHARLARPAARPARRAGTATSRTRRRPRRSRRSIAAREVDRAQRRRLLGACALVGRQGRAACSAWSCARCPPTTSSACAPTLLELDDVAVVVATVGTTSTASVDPGPGDRRRLRAAGAWLHVDAAYAGSSWVCPELRWTQAGVERADSLVVNAHKWLLTPMDCSCLWTRRPEELRAAFSLTPEFLRTSESRAEPLRATAPRSAAASAR